MDQDLLNKTIRQNERNIIYQRYATAYKEARLTYQEEIDFGKMLLQSPLRDDHHMDVEIFQEIIRNKKYPNDDELFEINILMIIGLIKLKDFEKAQVNIEHCQRKIQEIIKAFYQKQRLEQLEAYIKMKKNFNKTVFRAALGAIIGAIALYIFTRR